MAGPDLPRLAVLAGPDASLPPAEIARSADGLLDVVFVLDSRDSSPAGRDLREVTGALAPSRAVDLADPDACLAAVRGSGAGAVTTFTDDLCGVAAWLDEQVRGTAAVLAPWGRKDVQRRVLVDAGVSRVRSAPVDGEDAVRAFVRSAGLPVVVKPTAGAASRDTWLLRRESDVADFARLSGVGAEPGRRMLAEQFIVGAPSRTPQLADYVSAEVFRAGPTDRAFVTDRLVPAWPCRETGLVLPSVLTTEQQEPVLAAARRALDCLGVTSGVFHVEVKPASPTPEIIEVNGRLGGFVARLVRYGTGTDLGRLALSCALGRTVELDLSWDRCVLVLLFQPPAGAERVVRTPSRRDIARRPGVLAVDKVSPVGTAVDWRGGTNAAVAWVWLAGEGHLELHSRLADLAGFLGDAFGFVDDSGRDVADRPWLDLMTEGAGR